MRGDLAESDKEQNVSVAVTNHRNIDLSETRREKFNRIEIFKFNGMG